MNVSELAAEDEGDDGHELHEDVEGGPGGVLQRVAHSVTNNCGLVRLRSLSVGLTMLVLQRLALDVLLGIVPRAAGIGGRGGEHDSADDGAGQEAGEHLGAEDEADEERGEDDLSGGGVTRRPGAIISMRAARVEMLMQALKSGSEVPWMIPGLLFSCLLISSTIPIAALPTDLMVKAEKR